MPELPEVETCRAGLAIHIEGKTFQQVVIRQAQLRWPIPENLPSILSGLQLLQINRRGKYLLLVCTTGTLIIHLGMSGRVNFPASDIPAGKHDHIDFIFTDHTLLRFNDQRKFGAVLWHEGDIDQHPLLAKLGPEPLTTLFDGEYLFHKGHTRRIAIKSLIMDSQIVVGVGNIYASESLFLAGILPNRAASTINSEAYQKLADAIKLVLAQAIQQGGTTLRDFINPEGKAGYFQQSLNVYGRANQACLRCAQTIEVLKIANRSSFFCANCQV